MNLYSGVPLETLQTWLLEAQTAYHALAAGKRTVSITIDGRSKIFAQSDQAQLRDNIRELQRAIAVLNGLPDARQRPAVARWTR